MHEARDSPNQDTQKKFHASPSLVVHVDTREHSFQKKDRDNKEHAIDNEQAKSGGFVPTSSSHDFKIQQEKECNVNNGAEKDIHLIPFDTIDVTNSPDMCIEFQRNKKQRGLNY